MAAGHSFGFALVGAIVGTALGGGAGMLCGQAFNSVALTPNMVGFAGYVAALSTLCGIIAGFLAGILVGLRMAR